MLIIFNHSIMYTENITLPLINTCIYVLLYNFIPSYVLQLCMITVN